MVGRLVVIWFVRFTAKSLMTIFVCLFIWSSVLFFVSSYSRRSVVCSFVIVRVLVLPVVSSSVLFFLLVFLLFSCLIVPTSNVAV